MSERESCVLITLPGDLMDRIAARAKELGVVCGELAGYITERGLLAVPDLSKIQIKPQRREFTVL